MRLELGIKTVCALGLVASSASRVLAHDSTDHPQAPDPSYGATAAVTPEQQAASSLELRGTELRLSPYRSAADLLNRAPGFYVVQHAGGGKAQQYFLRGFDADHGTDVALHVDDVPVNAVSHGHGQGYADLNWVIPELVERVEVRKGPYFAELGDFATAGSARFVLARRMPHSALHASYGSFDTYRAVAIASPELESFAPILAAEVYRSDGPFESPEETQRLSALARSVHALGGGAELAATFAAYDAGWNASGQLPLREVLAGRLDRFGAIDPTEGGHTQRYSAALTLDAPTKQSAYAQGALHASVYAVRYDFDLYSNFTFFRDDASRGDMIHQRDTRTTVGLSGSYELGERRGDFAQHTRAGVQLRLDAIDNGLDRAPARELSAALQASRIGETSLGLHAEHTVAYRDDVRFVLGGRADAFDFEVEDTLQDRDTLGDNTGGRATAAMLSPKASVIVSPLPRADALELYGNAGLGFHSNDARAAVAGNADTTPLARAFGYELGVAARPIDALRLSAAAFVLELQSELVWVGDEGVTEASGATQRMGLEVGAELKALPWLVLDAQASLTRARFIDEPSGQDAVPLAPTFLLTGGASVRHRATGLAGRLALTHLADRPATEDRFLTAEGFTRVDASLRYEQPRYALELRAQNLLDVRFRQAQFATTSRLPGEDDASACPGGTRAVEEGGDFVGCEDIGFTPGAPLDLMATASLFF